MLQIINTFITSLSLGLFCIGINIYVDLHLGYEFLSIAIALEVASFLIAIAVSKNIKNLNIEAFSLVTLGMLMASAYLLFAMDFVTAYSYFIALMCIVVPVVLIGVFLINGGRKASVDSIVIESGTIKYMILSSSVGLFASMAITHLSFEWEGVWGIFMLSSAALTIAIFLQISISNLVKISALCLFVGVLFYVDNNQSMKFATWSLFDKPVSKYSLPLLNNLEDEGWLVEKSDWVNAGRVDIVTTRRSRNDGGYWAIYDANVVVPYALEANSSLEWWEKSYPLMMLPFELEQPSKVLTIASARGADADFSQLIYDAETISIYNDCFSFNKSTCDSSALNIKLETALNSGRQYDLISFSIYNEMVTPYVGVSAQHEAIHTVEVFQRLYNSLNSGGLLAINARNPTMMRKSLSYVWHVLSAGSDDRVISFKDNIRVLTVNKYNLKKDAYNYLVLVSKDGFTSEELQKINTFIEFKPVSKIMYGTANNNVPDNLTVSSAISALTKLSSRDFKKLINLEPSSIIKPNFFNLSMTLHPFFSVLSAIFLSLGLYGLIFAHSSWRSIDTAVHRRAPGLPILLFQTLLSATAFVLVLYAIVHFTSAALGYSSLYASLLIISTLAAFSCSPAWMNIGKSILSSYSGLWYYLVILLLCALILITMNQDLIALLSARVQAAIFVLAVLLAVCSGQLHRQTAMVIEQLYPEVNFWFWCMTSVGVVLGVILAQYIMIHNDLEIVVRTAMTLFIFMAFIAWWSLSALQDIPCKKSPIVEDPG